MAMLADTIRPYVHSNIYHFHGSLGSLTLERTRGVDILKGEVAEIRNLANHLKEATQDFAPSDQILNNRWHSTPDRLELLIREIITSHTFLNLLIKRKQEESDILYQLINKNRVREIRGRIAEDHAIISLEEATEAVLRTLPEELLMTDRAGQRAALASRFNARSLNDAIEKRLVRKLNANSSVFSRIVRESLEEVLEQQKTRLKYQGGFEDAMAYFKRQFWNRITKEREIWVCPAGALERYVKEVVEDLEGVVANAMADIQSTKNSRAVETDIYSSQGTVGFDMEFALGGVTKEDMQREILEKISTYSPPNHLLTTVKDLEIRRGNEYAEVKESTFEKEFLRKRAEDSPLIREMANTNSYTRLMDLMVSSPATTLGRDDYATTSYVLANTIWFNTKGSWDRSNRGRLRTLDEATDGLTYAHGIIVNVLRESLASVIAFEISEDLDINLNKTALFLLANGRTIVSTYSMLEKVAENLEGILQRLVGLDLELYNGRSGLSAAALWDSKIAAVAPEPLDMRKFYSDDRLVETGRKPGADIIGTTEVRLSGNYSLMKALASSFVF